MSGERKGAFEVKWRIENIRPWLQSRDDSLCSPPFLAETLSNTRWKLRLSRKWQLEEKCTSLALVRDVEDDHPKLLELNYELSFLAGDGSTLKSKSCKSKFAPNTVGQDLKVTAVEILKEKKEVYMSNGIMTVSCKLWIDWSTMTNKRQCSIRTVIGIKRVTLEGNMDHFGMVNENTNATVNFMSPYSEIGFISFNVELKYKYGHENTYTECGIPYKRQITYTYMMFERREVVCKCFSLYSCKLFAFYGEGKRMVLTDDSLKTLLTSNKVCIFSSVNLPVDLLEIFRLKNDASLTLQLEITYYPGIESECIEYGEENNYKKMTDVSAVLENVNTCVSEKVHSSPLDCLHLPEKEDKTCDIEKNESSVEDEDFNAASKRHLTTTTLKEDLTTLYEGRLFCDTKLRTDTETFPAHRNVLSARSPVFKKMFTTDMKEKAGECINVPDISSDTVRRMLQFLYTDCTGDLDMQSAKDLYIAADKYDIASLKQLCTSFMRKNLCPANVCEVLVLADMHQDKNLESATQEYVLDNDEEVFCSDEWKLLMKNYGSLAAQVMYLKFTKR